MKDNWRGVGSLNVMTSLRIANLNVVDAVAGVPTVAAVMVAVVKGVRVSGTPTSCTVFEFTFERESPVPARLVVLRVTGFPEAATALNWMLEV
jgi:hypothetical protein